MRHTICFILKCRIYVRVHADENSQKIALQVNTFRLTESDFCYDVILWRWRSWRLPAACCCCSIRQLPPIPRVWLHWLSVCATVPDL